MGKNICYQTRSLVDGAKLAAGSFGGDIDKSTVERLSRLFSVTVKPSGRVVFVDSKGREVSLYLYVDAASTEKGKIARAAWQAENSKQWENEARAIAQAESDIEEAMRGLSHAEIIRRLRGQ